MMGRFLHTFYLLIIVSATSYCQCPDLPPNTTLNGSSATSIGVCGSEAFTFEVSDPNLPNGTINWYSSTSSGFDPLTGGTQIGSSNVASSLSECSTCPAIEALYIDVCNNTTDSEEDNEFLIVSSGSGFAVDNFSLLFPFSSAGTDSDINTGDLCTWVDGDLGLVSGCAGNIVAAGPGDFIPANSTVVIQTSTTGTITYDLSPICGTSDCIYVLQNFCDRGTAGFKNCDVSGTRTVTIELTCGCSDPLTYDINAICSGMGDGTYITDEGLIGNSGCTTAPAIIAPPPVSHNSVTDPFTHSFSAAECNTTQFVVGVLDSDENNTDCCNTAESQTNEYSIDVSCATAELSQDEDGVLCPGDCETITITFTGGTAPYNLNLNLATSAPFPLNNIPLPIPGFPVDQKLTICYDAGGPPYDPSTFTVDVPAIAQGAGTLSLNSFTDANGCAGTIIGSSITLSFNDAPNIVTPPPFTECAMTGGTAFFILTNYDAIINGGSGLPVNYFLDDMGLMPLASPYETATTTIYAQVDGTPCDSEIVPIELQVILNGDAGLVTFFCTDAMGTDADCTVCDDDGTSGEEITLTIIFEDPSIVYDYEVVWTADSGPSSTIIGNSSAGTGTAAVMFNIFETTTFEITVVTPAGECADMTDLGDIVTVNYSLEPQMADPGLLSGCGSVILPPINGNIVPTNAAYYTQQDGAGAPLQAGDAITTTGTIYLYAGIADCEQEIPIQITINEAATINDPGPIMTCGSYTLPLITGTNVENANYYAGPGGTGGQLAVGQQITTDLTVFIFDPVCGGNEVNFDITITAGAVITTGPDTIVCDTFILPSIEGMDLTGGEGYFTESGGLGQQIAVGDTITTDSLIHIYDNSPGCEISIPFQITINSMSFPGLDASVPICQGDATVYALPELLAGPSPDTTGRWIEQTTNIVLDSSMVDFSSLSAGQYEFIYEIRDSICGDTASSLTITILGTPNAGSDFLLAICDDVLGINMLDSLQGADLGGTFYDDAGAPITFDPTNATFLAGTPIFEIYQYIVGDPSSSCGADTSIFSVISGANANAGMDRSEAICFGLTVDVTDYLMGQSDIGTFSEPVPSGGLSGSSFNTTLVNDGQAYEIYHIVPGSGPCPDDTATITLTVVDAPNAGDENSATLCGDTSYDLSLLINGDSGGTYYQGSTALSSSVVDFTNETGTLDYAYIIGDGAGCPFDTAQLTLIRTIQPPVSISVTPDFICPDESVMVTISSSSNGSQVIDIFYSISGSDGTMDSRMTQVVDFTPPLVIPLSEGLGGLGNDMVAQGVSYQVVIDSMRVVGSGTDCSYLIGELISFGVGIEADTMLTGSYCADEFVNVGSDVYDINNMSGVTTLTTQSGCDSTITVDLEFVPEVPGLFEMTLCDGDSITILGVQYSTSFEGDTLLTGASAGGCDSLLTIDITTTDPSIGNLDSMVCSGYMIEIAGEVFDEMNSMGEAIILGGAASGCDSTVVVNLAYSEDVMSLFDTTVCAGYTIMVNGQTYDEAMPTGMEVLAGQSASGCDSIVMIDLDYSGSNIDTLVQFSTCDNDLFLVIGGEVFNRVNTSGMVTVPSTTAGCDTIYTVDITYGEMMVDFEVLDGTCMVPDTGMLVINSINGQGPFDLMYNGNNAIVSSPILPYAVALPVGSGTIDIIDRDPTAGDCMTTIEYDIAPGVDLSFSIAQFGNQMTLIGGTPDSIVWSPSESLSCDDCLDPEATPETTTMYTATIYYGGDCIEMIDFLFEVIDDTPDYILPNIFSPNQDGANENFALQITEGAVGVPVSMTIYDRWGNLMFESRDPSEITSSGWNGEYGGSRVSPGVYVYQVSVLEGTEIINLFGDLTVVR